MAYVVLAAWAIVRLCADNIRGPWRWEKGFKPDGLDSFDMTAWQDEDGSAYLARSVQNAYLGVSRLDSTFSKTLGVCASTSQACSHKLWNASLFKFKRSALNAIVEGILYVTPCFLHSFIAFILNVTAEMLVAWEGTGKSN